MFGCRTNVSRPARLSAALLLVLILGSCGRNEVGSGGDDSPTPSPSASDQPGTAVNSCFSPSGAYRVTYPQDWHVNDPETGMACSWFHPEEFTLPVATEATELAIHIAVENAGFEQVVEGTETGPGVKQVLSRSEATVSGRGAVRFETEASGEALYPEGTRQTVWVARWGEGRALVASTTTLADGDYQNHQTVLDEMMSSLQPSEQDGSCSAAALEAEVAEQEGLPGAVAQTRRELVEAAVECDFDRLGELAAAGDDGFSFTFGGSEDPVAYWRMQESEATGSDPMRFLAGMLKRSYATVQVDGVTFYVWPSAFGHDGWDEIPEAALEELKPLYNEPEFAQFERFGNYTGYRVGIEASGEWRYFIAGD